MYCYKESVRAKDKKALGSILWSLKVQFQSIGENIKDFREESTLKTWAYRITINKSLDFLKSKKRLKRIFFFKSLKIDDQEKKISIPEINHPGVILENKESVNAIFNGINKLPSKLKTVIILLKIRYT